MSDAMMRLEGETFVQAELLRRGVGLTDDETKALALGMLAGVGNFLEARFVREAPAVVELPPIGGGIKLVWSRRDVTIASWDAQA